MANFTRFAIAAFAPLLVVACSGSPDAQVSKDTSANESVGQSADALSKMSLVTGPILNGPITVLLGCGNGTILTDAVVWDGSTQLWDKTGVIIAEIGGTDLTPAADGSMLHDLVGIRASDKVVVGRARVSEARMPCFLSRHGEKYHDFRPPFAFGSGAHFITMPTNDGAGSLIAEFDPGKTLPVPRSCGTRSYHIASFSYPDTCVAQDLVDAAAQFYGDECIALGTLPNACRVIFRPSIDPHIFQINP